MAIIDTTSTQTYSALGTAAFLLGVLAAAWYANEWMTMGVSGDPPFTLQAMPEPDCDPHELEEEGLTLTECHQMAMKVQHISLSSPGWFPAFHATFAALGSLLALLSLLVAAGLVEGRRWAPAAAVTVFGALCLVDAAAFAGVTLSGPMVRQTYLWSLLLWFSLHLTLLAAAAAIASSRTAGARPAGDQPPTRATE